jgi:hypothetical protein
MFLNEFDLLDLKIAEELELIDKLVISEADRTYQGESKPLHLTDNPKYQHPKIELVRLTSGFVEDPWENERLQRNSLLQPFDGAVHDDDVFIVSDVDEINNREDIPRIVEQARVHGLVRLVLIAYCYKINLMVKGYRGLRSFAVTGHYLRVNQKQLNDIRFSVNEGKRLRTQGKHFTYLGGAENISYKLKSFAHTEYNHEQYTDPEQIEQRIRTQTDPFDHGRELVKVEVDDSYPSTILSNLEFWRKHIC